MYFNDNVDRAKPITGTRELNNMLSYCFIKYEYITTIKYVRIIIQIFLVQLVSQDLSNSTLLFLFFIFSNSCSMFMFILQFLYEFIFLFSNFTYIFFIVILYDMLQFHLKYLCPQ